MSDPNDITRPSPGPTEQPDPLPSAAVSSTAVSSIAVSSIVQGPAQEPAASSETPPPIDASHSVATTVPAPLAVGQAQGRAAGRFHLDVTCPHCGVPISRRDRTLGGESCLACHRPFEAVFFDPPPIPSHILRLQEAGPEGGHPCAAHGENLAVTHCSRCGVFMCSLCRIEIEDMELCPACYQRLRQAGELVPLRLESTDFGRYALILGILAIFPLTFFGFALGPAAIYFASKGLKQSAELRRTSGRKMLQVSRILGIVGTLLSLGFIAMMISGMMGS